MIWLLCFPLQLYMITRCPSGLGQESLLAAQAWQNGLLPYRDFQMHVGLFPASLFYALFSIPPLMWCSLVFCLFNMLTLWGVYRLSGDYLDTNKRWIPPLLFLVFNAFLDGNSLHVETIMTAFGLWGFIFYEDERYIWMAGAFFLAICCKQTAILYPLAVLPFLPKEGRIKAGATFMGLGIALLAVLQNYGMLQAAFSQLFLWTFQHGVGDPWGNSRLFHYPSFFIRASPLILLSSFARIPRPWLLLFALFSAVYLITPEPHYLLGILPFLCVTSVMKLRIKPAFIYVGCALAGFALAKGVFLLSDQAMGARKYGLMDDYYYARVVKGLGKLPEPVWTNHPNLYFVNKWPIIGNDFLAQIESGYDGDRTDWNSEPIKSVRTRLFFMHNLEEYKSHSGKVVPLERGVYHWLKVEQTQ